MVLVRSCPPLSLLHPSRFSYLSLIKRRSWLQLISLPALPAAAPLTVCTMQWNRRSHLSLHSCVDWCCSVCFLAPPVNQKYSKWRWCLATLSPHLLQRCCSTSLAPSEYLVYSLVCSFSSVPICFLGKWKLLEVTHTSLIFISLAFLIDIPSLLVCQNRHTIEAFMIFFLIFIKYA